MKLSPTLRTYIKDPHMIIPWTSAGVGIVWMVCIAFFKFFSIKEKIIIHANARKEIDVIGSRKDIFFIILAYGVLWGMNMILAHTLYKRQRFMSYCLGYGTAWMCFVGLIIITTIAIMN